MNGKSSKKANLTPSEKNLAEIKFNEGYLAGIYRAVLVLDKYTGSSPQELLEEIRNCGAITQEDYEQISQWHGLS